MRDEFYKAFREAESKGLKKQAKAAVQQFVACFESFDEKEAWTRSFLKQHEYGGGVRYEIYANIIFPVLLDGLHRQDAWSVYWLAGTAQNHYSDARLHAKLGHQSELQLIKAAYSLDPGKPEIRVALLSNLISFFNYAVHEWPSGILWGMDGATVSECNVIQEEIDFARTLDGEQRHTEFLDDFQDKLKIYLERIS